EKLEKPCVAEASKEETLKPKDMDRSTSDDDEEDVDGHQHKGISLDDLSDDWVEAQMKDVTVAVIGNVDSGKSTLVGVLTKGGLDDGRGLARAKVFNFSHEAANGRTSSIAQEIMGFSPTGEQVLIDRMGTSTASSRNQTWQQVVSQSERLVTFSDLCGHEKYLKTTIFGLVGQCPDYTMIIVNANAGFQRMSREHLGIALALRIPFFIVITKIDIAPQNVFDENLAQLHKIVKSNAVKRQPLVVTSDDQLEQAASGIYGKQVCPMFCISNVTGEGLPLLRSFLQRLPSRLQDSGLFKPPSSPAEFHIDSIYVVPGVGLVVGGVVRSGRICPGQHLLLGPDKVSQFKPVMVKTIQYKRVTVDMAESGQHCSFALRSLVKRETLKKSMFRKGMVMLGPELQPRAIWSFKAELCSSALAMVIKTDLCNYTEYRIYPGHGQKFVAKDAKVNFFISAKADSLYHQRIKPVKLRWTQAWRRQNKKGKVEEGGKKKARKAQKFQKAIVGMSLDDLKKKKAMRPELRQAREQAAKEAKAKQQADKKKAASSKPAVPKGKADKGAKLPKGGGAPAGGVLAGKYRIYPGHGQKFVAKVNFFISAKADSLYHQRIKPVKLRWTQAWRRQNKKGKVEEGGKKKARKAQKFQKAIVGMSLDDLKKKKAMRPELRQAREQAAKEAKAKQQADKKKAASSKPAVPKGKADKGAKLPKGGGAPAGGAVVILHHATTIREGYQAMIHCGIIRQCAAVKNMSCELLRSGDKAIVTFRWCYHAEYVCLGETLLFREGRTKGRLLTA
ncbi:GTPBP1, partial [Symbiodinium sp. KB8]